jgi:hypothetical protein
LAYKEFGEDFDPRLAPREFEHILWPHLFGRMVQYNETEAILTKAEAAKAQR